MVVSIYNKRKRLKIAQTMIIKLRDWRIKNPDKATDKSKRLLKKMIAWYVAIKKEPNDLRTMNFSNMKIYE